MWTSVRSPHVGTSQPTGQSKDVTKVQLSQPVSFTEEYGGEFIDRSRRDSKTAASPKAYLSIGGDQLMKARNLAYSAEPTSSSGGWRLSLLGSSDVLSIFQADLLSGSGSGLLCVLPMHAQEGGTCCIWSVLGTSWRFWIVYFLSLRHFPAWWRVLSWRNCCITGFSRKRKQNKTSWCHRTSVEVIKNNSL